jgi:hypothetical protein
MKSQIYSAYVAGLCPLQLLMEPKKYESDSHRQRLSAPIPEHIPADLPRRPSQRTPALLLILTLGLAITAWQLLSRVDETRAAAGSVQGAASGKSILLFVLIVVLTIGVGQFFSHTDETRAIAASTQNSAPDNHSVLCA